MYVFAFYQWFEFWRLSTSVLSGVSKGLLFVRLGLWRHCCLGHFAIGGVEKP